MKKPSISHYVDNKKFLEALREYKKEVGKAKEEGKERPKVSNYIGECFMKIAVHLSYKANFIGYTFKDEMISDGIENCLRYVDNFDTERDKPNPFAYFTTIIYYAFVRRIEKEKEGLYTRYKIFKGADIAEMAETQDHDVDADFFNASSREWSMQHIEDFIGDFEKRRNIGKKRRRRNAQPS